VLSRRKAARRLSTALKNREPPSSDSGGVVTGIDPTAHAYGHVLAAGAASVLESRWPRDYNLVAPDELLQEYRRVRLCCFRLVVVAVLL